MKEVLIVDDEAAMLAALEANFKRRGWQVRSASGVSEALSAFRVAPSRLVITDMRMADGDGLQVMEGVRKYLPETPVILLTAYGTVPDAVLAMRGGACDYLQKPISFEELESTAERFITHQPETLLGGHETEVVGPSLAFRRVIEQAKKVARSEVDILVEAESGTGKEVLARLIHQHSHRRSGPFVAVNCSAFPENLLESELFGHVRGAFTGAQANKAGKFELAHGGTLLLDEVGDLPLSLQPKLLRALQEREIDRLGDTKPVSIDVRIIATTNQSLPQQVKAGSFRADLFYRLHVVPLTIPPLRERREDILPLAHHFLRKYEPLECRGLFRIAPELAEQLQAYDWPGNVRELENTIRRELAFAVGTTLDGCGGLLGCDLQEQQETAGVKPGVTLQEMERRLLEATLEATGGNRTRAAALMGVSLRTVRNKIREFGLQPRRLS
ncbi:MAG TPA: sigma-54 dependent transcriptional regulator [Candidatus Sulfotelmatobacter sp.]|nr:sigma-54 dependent transcriptional regulator [Candidatus Sulfotelmatobacter sp.]